MIFWFFTIPTWLILVVLLVFAAIAKPIFKVIDILLCILCAISVPAFLVMIRVLILKIQGEETDSWQDIIEGLIGTGIFAVIGLGLFLNHIFNW